MRLLFNIFILDLIIFLFVPPNIKFLSPNKQSMHHNICSSAQRLIRRTRATTVRKSRALLPVFGIQPKLCRHFSISQRSSMPPPPSSLQQEYEQGKQEDVDVDHHNNSNDISKNNESKEDTMEQDAQNKFTNRLAHESSPYLLQHAHNPVDWYPWGEEAFRKSREEDKPIFLSVGYSVCHWCHVMERESFENEEIARIMNENFINVKVDREERPDVDRVYMTFVQATTGSGGWPMSVFLTPDLLPFFGGTYFPPADAFMRPGFPSLLQRIAKLWKENREELINRGTKIIEALRENSAPEALEPSALEQKQKTLLEDGNKLLTKCLENYLRQYDEEHGGFGSAPKFPRPSIFNFITAALDNPDIPEDDKENGRDAVFYTLTKMAQGGMYDFLGGGFARYSVDDEFMIPHFEKMLYDQGQLIASYADAYSRTGDTFFLKIVRECIEYLERDLCYVDPNDSTKRAFCSAEDADSLPHHGASEKKEGAFYLWHYDELEIHLTKEEVKLEGVDMDPFAFFCDLFDIKKEGNIPPERDPHEEFGDLNVLHQRHSLQDVCTKHNITLDQGMQLLEQKIKPKLFRVREQRPRPHLDDKIITAWNGLSLTGLAKAAMAIEDQRDHYIALANQVARFIETHLFDKEKGRLLRNVRECRGHTEGYLQDYAFLIQGLLDLYDVSAGSEEGLYWLGWAADLQRTQDDLFKDEQNGGYFDSTGQDESVLVRMKEDHDGAEPAGSSVAVLNLLRLSTSGVVSQEQAETYVNFAHKTIATMALHIMERYPQAIPQMMTGLDQLLVVKAKHVHRQVAIVYNDALQREKDEFVKRIHKTHGVHGHLTLIYINVDKRETTPMRKILENMPHLSDVQVRENKPTAFLCQNFACQEPVTDIDSLISMLK